MKNKKILIVGAGWLGIPLAKFLSNQQQVQVECYFRSEKTKTRLEEANLSLFSNKDWTSFDVVILCFPPSKEKAKYKASVEAITQHLSKKTHLIFTSSTGIYPNEPGIFTETTKFTVSPEKKHLWEAEQSIAHFKNHTILRLAGLIGGDRHPIKYLSGKQLKNPDGKIHIIHREEVIQKIYHVIQKKRFGILNVVSPLNLTRFEYYTQSAEKRKIPPPIRVKENKMDRIILPTP